MIMVSPTDGTMELWFGNNSHHQTRSGASWPLGLLILLALDQLVENALGARDEHCNALDLQLRGEVNRL